MYSLTHFFSLVGREMTARGNTNLFFMLSPFSQCSHPYFHSFVSVAHDISGGFSLPPAQFACSCMYVWGIRVLHWSVHQTHTQTRSYAASLSHLSVMGTRGPGWLPLTSWHQWGWYDPPALSLNTHSIRFPCIPISRHSVKDPVKALCGTLLEGPYPLPLSHLLTSCHLTSSLP